MTPLEQYGVLVALIAGTVGLVIILHLLGGKIRLGSGSPALLVLTRESGLPYGWRCLYTLYAAVVVAQTLSKDVRPTILEGAKSRAAGGGRRMRRLALSGRQM